MLCIFKSCETHISRADETLCVLMLCVWSVEQLLCSEELFEDLYHCGSVAHFPASGRPGDYILYGDA
jgi:hypothetical protein